MKQKVFILILMIIPWLSNMYAQKLLTLQECYQLAMSANALAGEKEANSNISKLRDENLTKGWLPSLDANASLVYNSEVVDLSSAMDTPIPGLRSIPHDQYRITIDINQVIYDGGSIKGARDLEKANLNISVKQTEADMYKLREEVNTYYFSLLLLGRHKELLNKYLELINKRISSMQSAADNGMILKSDIDVLTAEKIKTEQQLYENNIKRSSLLKILAAITGAEIDDSTEFILPVPSGEFSNELARPELQLFDLKNKQLEAGFKVLESQRMPKAFGFATLGYGNPPGSNFFKDEFAPYYILGAGIKWNIFDWNKTKNDKQLITMQKGIIDNRKTDLSDNLQRRLEYKQSEIAGLQSLIATDSELIALRKRITATAESQYDNGSITATEYLNEMNTEQQAVINHEIHKINLALARIQYFNISGKEIE